MEAFRKRHFSPVRLLNTLFVSEEYWRRHIEHPTRFVIDNLWKLYADMQSIDADKQTDLSQYFTSDELYGIWLARNAEWYISHGPSIKGVSTQMQRQRHLLRNREGRFMSGARQPESITARHTAATSDGIAALRP